MLEIMNCWSAVPLQAICSAAYLWSFHICEPSYLWLSHFVKTERSMWVSHQLEIMELANWHRCGWMKLFDMTSFDDGSCFFFTIYILYIHTSLFVVHTVDSLESSTPPFRNRRIWGPNLRSSFVGSCFNPAAAVPDLCFGKVETCFQIPAAKTPISNRKHSRW